VLHTGVAPRAWLVYLGGYGPGNWELVVDMTSLGRQTVRFADDPVPARQHRCPDDRRFCRCGRDGHAEIFVKTTAGASTQFWTIFTLSGRQIRQVTSQGQPYVSRSTERSPIRTVSGATALSS
jgi:hypothetical protein